MLLFLLRLLARWWCRWWGAEVAPTALIHGFPRIKIAPGGRIILDDHCTINAACWANPLNDGRRTVLHAGPGATIHLRPRSGISSSRLIAFSGITLGEDSLVGAGSLLCDSDMHALPLPNTSPPRSSPIEIGQHAFIGAHCILLKGVHIGHHAVIGAGTTVTQNIPNHATATGQGIRVRGEG